MGSNSQQWLACIAASIYFFFVLLLMSLPNTLSPYIVQYWHLSTDQLSKFSTYYFWSASIFFIPAGFLFEYLSTRSLVLTSFFILMISIAVLSLTHSLQTALVTRIIAGIGYSFAFVSYIRLVSHWCQKNMASMMGIVTTIGLFGSITAQTPATIIAESFGWRHMLLMIVGIGFLGWLILWIIVTDTYIEKVKFKTSDVIIKLKTIITNKNTWLCAAYACLLNTPILIFGDLWGNLYLTHVYGLSNREASYISSMLFLGLMIGCPLIGLISDKIQNVRNIIIINALLLELIFIPLYFHVWLNLPYLIINFFMIGLIASAQSLVYVVVTKNCASNIRSISIAVVTTFVMFGNAFLQFLYKELLSLHFQGIFSLEKNSYQTALILMPLAFILSFILTFFITDAESLSG